MHEHSAARHIIVHDAAGYRATTIDNQMHSAAAHSNATIRTLVHTHIPQY